MDGSSNADSIGSTKGTVELSLKQQNHAVTRLEASK